MLFHSNTSTSYILFFFKNILSFYFQNTKYLQEVGSIIRKKKILVKYTELNENSSRFNSGKNRSHLTLLIQIKKIVDEFKTETHYFLTRSTKSILKVGHYASRPWLCVITSISGNLANSLNIANWYLVTVRSTSMCVCVYSYQKKSPSAVVCRVKFCLVTSKNLIEKRFWLKREFLDGLELCKFFFQSTQCFVVRVGSVTRTHLLSQRTVVLVRPVFVFTYAVKTTNLHQIWTRLWVLYYHSCLREYFWKFLFLKQNYWLLPSLDILLFSFRLLNITFPPYKNDF